MELVLPMYNVHPYFSLKNLGKKVSIIHGKIWYSVSISFMKLKKIVSIINSLLPENNCKSISKNIICGIRNFGIRRLYKGIFFMLYSSI